MNAVIDGGLASAGCGEQVGEGAAACPAFSISQVIRVHEPHAISLCELLTGNHEFVQQVFERNQDGVICATLDGAIVHFNLAAERMFGYKAVDVLGVTLPKLIPAPVLEQFLSNGGEATAIDSVQGLRANGGKLPMRLNMSLMPTGLQTLIVTFVRDLHEIDLKQREIERLAHIDALTGLPNRNLFQDRLRQVLASSKRFRQLFALMYIDLDHFKEVNDTYGHAVGDAVLKEIGSRLRSAVRDTDTMARVGGDEFVAVLANLRLRDDVNIVADRVLNMCKQPIHVVGVQAPITLGASIGIAVYPSDATELEPLQLHADSAMYHAKRAGRGRYSFYTRELNEAAERRVVIERGLHRALSNQGLILHYQPQIDLKTGKLLGAEALMRWMQDGTMMQPAEFIPVAEESGLIVPMGEWALREACARAEGWRREGLGHGMGIRIGVNLSMRQFSDGLPDLIFQILEETGLPPQLLDLEITESFLADAPRAQAILKRLQDADVHLSVDDFGTGYSCLAYLRHLPLDTIKIDRSFITGIESDSTSRAIVSSLVRLAQDLGHATLAEGVETEQQADMLRDLGVDACQGYFFSRPLPQSGFELFAREAR